MIELILLVCTTTGSICVEDSIASYDKDPRVCLFQAPALTYNHLTRLGPEWELKKWECKLNTKDYAQHGR